MIQILNSNLVNQIAAGEVIERPASIVKELVENSIDAGAKNIKVFIEEGGIKKITVQDDGSGISKEDLPLVFINHATSKIITLNDLLNISSFGFRGEAMASINSIAKVKILTNHNEESYELVGESITPASVNKGATIIVEDVFYNIPARRKFLKTESTEFRYIADTITKIALANPSISFELFKDNKKFLSLPVDQKLKDRVEELLKLKNTFPLYYDGKIKIEGFAIDPKYALSKANNQYIFVNGRSIISPFINRAIIQGYGNSLMKGQYPSYVISLQIPPEEIDVNVHPRKIEVRFKTDAEVFQSVYYCVKDAMDRFQKSLISQIGNFLKYDQKPQDEKPIYDNQNIVTKFDQNVSANSVKFDNFSNSKIDVQAALKFNEEIVATKKVEEQTMFNNIEQAGEAKVENIELSTECLQIHNSFIVTSNSNGILIIDQHAASERYLFEKFLKSVESAKIEQQTLSFPIHLELSVTENATLSGNLDVLNNLGFGIEAFGINDYVVNAIPTIIKSKNVEGFIKELISDIDNSSKATLNTAQKKIAASLACHSAVRFGDRLDQSEMIKIIEDLKTCDNPYTCPHGRPVVHTISSYELLKTFKRVL